VITMPSYRLGAEELIELGRAKNAHNAGRQPFFSTRPRLSGAQRMGIAVDLAKEGMAFISGQLAFAINTLADVTGVPAGIMSRGSDITLNAVSDLLEKVPAIGDLLAEILVLGGAATKSRILVPGLAPIELGNILSGVGKALGAKNTTADVARKISDAQDRVVQKAPAGSRDAVRQILGAAWGGGE